MPELTAPFVYKNEDKQIVYGPVLVPDEPDSDNDVVTAEHIENVAHKFVEDYGNIDLMHSLNNVGKLVESYILPVDLEVDKDTTVPQGSWIMGVRVTDDDVWKSVKEKKLGGFSIMAMQKTAMKSAEKNNKDSKRVTLADLGDDWIVNAVSLVDEPAVPKAKWIAIKSKGDNDSNTDSNIDMDTVTKAVEGSLEHRKRLIDSKLDKTFMSYERTPIIHSTLMDSVIFRIHDDSGNRKAFQVGYNLLENGEVEFTEEPREVMIQETVVEVNNMLSSQNSKGDTEEHSDQSEGFMSKFMNSIGLGAKASEKAGKTISNSNLKKLQQAREVIDELMAIGEKERESKSKQKDGASKMEKEDVKAMIDESFEPLNSKLDDVLKAMKDDAKGDGSEGGSSEEGSEKKKDDDKKDSSEKGKVDDDKKDDSSKKDKGDGKDDDEDYKEKYESVLKELEDKKDLPFSHRLAGQDDSSTKSKDDDEKKVDRNAFGYKNK